MATRQIAERKERSMAELFFIIIIMGVLAVVFIRIFFAQEQKITEAAFEALAQNFASKVQITFGQWQMDSQPNVVKVVGIETSGVQFISVNNNGWIDVQDSETPCHDIWQLVTDGPLMFMNNPVSVVRVAKSESNELVCRYIVVNNDYTYQFDYYTNNGKVVY